MPPSSSKSARDKLGERLRKAAPPTAADLDALHLLQTEHDRALQAVVRRLQRVVGSGTTGEGLVMTHRVKTMNTLIEKLQRSKTRLSTVQDLAGVRIVSATTLGHAEQDALVQHVVDEFGEAVYAVDDLRSSPSFGYRAVHVLIEFDGFRVEVQVRTHWQHFWANATERIADTWGRGIRYGQPPDGATDEERAARARAFAHWLAVSDLLVQLEEDQAALVDQIVEDVIQTVPSGADVDMALQATFRRSDVQARIMSLAIPVVMKIAAGGAEIATLVRRANEGR